jgi:hypothetical protein
MEGEIPCYPAQIVCSAEQIYIEIQIAGRVQTKGRIYRKNWTIFEKGR